MRALTILIQEKGSIIFYSTAYAYFEPAGACGCDICYILQWSRGDRVGRCYNIYGRKDELYKQFYSSGVLLSKKLASVW